MGQDPTSRLALPGVSLCTSDSKRRAQGGWVAGSGRGGERGGARERERGERPGCARPSSLLALSLSLWGVCATPPPAHFLLPSLILTHRTGATRPADRQARADDILCLEGRGGVRNRGEEEKKGVVRPGEHTLAFRLSPSLSSVHGRLPDQARPPSHPGALSLIAVHAGRVPRVASLGPRTRP